MSADDKLYERFGSEFPANHVLFREGETGKEMYVIQAGKVRISKKVRDVEKTLVTLPAGVFDVRLILREPLREPARYSRVRQLDVVDVRQLVP